MNTCNILYFNKPAHTTSSTPIDDIQFVNFFNFVTKYVCIPIYVYIFRLWIEDEKVKSFIILLSYSAFYAWMDTKLKSISVNYDNNCVVPHDNPYFHV